MKIDTQETLIASPTTEIAGPRGQASPRVGTSLAAVTEVRGQPIREAVAILQKGEFSKNLVTAFSEIFSTGAEIIPNSATLHLRTAWNLISICIAARLSGQCDSRCGIQEAEAWFRQSMEATDSWLSSSVSIDSLREAETLLNTIQLDSDFCALLPYILEEHGPGSRASVIKDPTTASARAAKRMAGVFYTPADVADYMVGHTKDSYDGNFLTAKCLDPACGTGVFLLALLHAAAHAQPSPNHFSKFKYVTDCLHGIDVSGHALDAASFILMHECLTDITSLKLSPLTAWRLIRRNLITMDAICIGVGQKKHAGETSDLFEDPLPSIIELFPGVRNGFDILIGNPPYAALGERKDFHTLWTQFASLRGANATTRLNLFPLFIEMMWRFTKTGCSSSALVTPLSIAFHSGSQFESCRHAMRWSGGQWQFAFFDREPHALFGEEAKTRNAIIFRQENSNTPQRGQAARIESGPLRKWTSRTRERLFQSIYFTSLDLAEITSGIPKLDGSSQADAFIALQRHHDRIRAFAARINTCELAEALSGGNEPKVFVGATAYNFLNVYRPTQLLHDERAFTLSQSPVHSLEFHTETEARAAFSILSSRLSFWLWHVLGDGFHVAGWLFDRIPFSRSSFSACDLERLSLLGNRLWNNLQSHRFTSLNADRLTVGFRPLACQQERDEIDAILIRSVGLKEEFMTELRSFVQKNAVVDPSDERRSHVRKYFA